uniref:YncE family protein n=1 Tax=candidate division WOR-3 bacterium TaxID=2052148 RepID=A0A7C3J5M7_UNCW3
MKKNFFILSILSILLFSISCSLLKKEPSENSIYILDWEKEAVYTVDSLFKLKTTPLLTTGTAPTDIYVDENNIYITNSGFGGVPSIEKYDISGNKIAQIERGDLSSPAYIDGNENYIFVTDWLSNSFLKIEKSSFSIVDSISLTAPQEVVYKDGFLYVGSNNTSLTGHIYKISEDFKNVETDLSKGSNPSYLDIDDDNNIYVSLVGNYDDIKGKIKKIKNGVDLDSLSFETYLGKVKVVEDKIFLTDIFSKLYILDKDLNILNTINIPSPSDIEYFKGKIVVSTNVGKIYLVDFSELTLYDSLDYEIPLKVAEMFVK